MIVFDLRCTRGHVFEGWFGSSDDFETQKAAGYVECPLCACRQIDKAVMAPAISAKGNRTVTDADRKAQLKQLADHQAQIEARCDYVGGRFVEEARARHKQEQTGAQMRGIVGEASLSDAMDLMAEGIPVSALPFRPRGRADA